MATEYERLDINQISYEWLDKTNEPKLLKKALRLLKEDGGYFPELEKSIDEKLRTIDLKYKKFKETENITAQDIEKCKEEMLKFEEEYNKKDKTLSEIKESKDSYNYDLLKIQRKQEANNEKIKGNELMKTKEYDEAIKHYTKSIQLDEFEPTTYANRAQAYIKNTEYGRGLEDCNKAIDLKNDYIKAYYRRGMCYEGLKKYYEGLLDYLFVLNDNPDNTDLLTKIKDLNEKWKKYDKDGYDKWNKRMTINLNRAKEGKYVAENRTFKGDQSKGVEGFTKISIVEDTVEDKSKKEEDKKNESIKEEDIKDEESKTKNSAGGFKKIQIIEED